MKAMLAQHLKDARALIADESRWCQLELAMDEDGFCVDATSTSACKFCAVGALIAIIADTVSSDFLTARRALNNEAYFKHGMCMINVNDTIGHAAVIECFDLAIAEAEARSADSNV